MTSPTSGAPTPPGTASTRCPSCGAAVVGRFCSECGAEAAAGRCADCRTELSPGAKFCHRCGLAAGTAATTTRIPGAANVVPWAIAVLAFMSRLAGQRFGQKAGPQPAANDATPGVAAGRPPSLQNMSPEEQRQRLFNRVMGLAEAGKQDSVMFFAPMAIMAFQQYGPLDADGHYDLGRIAEVSGDAELAAAEADSVLAREPKHLLGLLLAAGAAGLRNDTAKERTFYTRFLDALPDERGKNRVEYSAHEMDITTGTAKARAKTGR